MCSTAEPKRSLFFQTLVVFASSPGDRVGCYYSCKEHVLGSSPHAGVFFLNFILVIFVHVVLARIILVLVYYYYYCNVLGVLFTKELYCTPKSQYTTVKHSQQLFEHT
jgi:hypothetical protein